MKSENESIPLPVGTIKANGDSASGATGTNCFNTSRFLMRSSGTKAFVVIWEEGITR